MVRLGQAVLDAVCLTDHVEAHRPGIDSVPVPRLLRELNAVIRENGVDLIGLGFEQELKELPGRLSVSCGNELGDGKLGGPVDSDEQVKLPFAGLDLSNVDVEEPNGLALELLPLGLVALDIRQP